MSSIINILLRRGFIVDFEFMNLSSPIVLNDTTFCFSLVLMKCFNGFCKEGVVHADTVGEILQMMGLRVKKEALQAIIDEVDEDGKTKNP